MTVVANPRDINPIQRVFLDKCACGTGIYNYPFSGGEGKLCWQSLLCDDSVKP